MLAIGDVQGCHQPMERLLARVRSSAGEPDRLWFTGDLVNRGPASLAVLRHVRSLGGRAITVLGNHDLHLVATALGARSPRPGDTFRDVLEAPERGELLEWLLARPLLHVDEEDALVLVHAGLPPQWSVGEARERAAEVEAVLRGESPGRFLQAMYGNAPPRWRDDLEGPERLRYIVNAFTRERFVTPDGELELGSTGPEEAAPRGYLPWFRVPGRRSRSHRIVFGHWAALELDLEEGLAENVIHLDTGCVWGRSLTGVLLPELVLYSVPCAAPGTGARTRSTNSNAQGASSEPGG